MFDGVEVIEIDGAAPKRLALPVTFGDRALVVVLSGLVEGFLDRLNIANDDLTRRWKLAEEDTTSAMPLVYTRVSAVQN